MDFTLHIATDGHFAPPTNDGSNPLAIGSEYHLGPDLGIFGLQASADLSLVDFEDHFEELNVLRAVIPSSALVIVHGAKTGDQSPFDLRIRIAGVCYKVPFEQAKRIRAKNGGTVFWRTTRHPLEADNEGRFRFWRHAPGVF